MNLYKFKHFYKNKYILSNLKNKKYHLSYNYKYKCLWFRTYKVASRSIDQHFRDNTPDNQYIYSSSVAYCARNFKNWYKFSFVREPEDRFISSWKDKVLNQNYYNLDLKLHENLKELPNFISWVENKQSNNINDLDEHLKPQHQLIDLNNIDFLGRFETFAEDFHKLAFILNMPLKDVHFKNTTKKKEIIIDDNSRERIKELYKLDYEIFYPHRR